MNMNALMQQAKKMQEQMQKAQEELENAEVVGKAGGEMVVVTMNGKKEIKSIKLDKTAVDPDDVEMLEDLIIVAIKDASGNILETMKLLNILPRNFAVYSGDDNLTYPMMCMGAKGVISVTANAYPNLVSTMCDSILNRDYTNALRLHKYLYKISSGLFLDVNPICIKYYLNLLGRNVGITRLPLTEPTIKIKRKLERLKAFYEN
jgi:DNA-binding YbaB/EbfC family protein